jgi:hypothetical protein
MQNKNITHILSIVGLILLAPLFGNIFISGWNWDLFDFIVMGSLLFVIGLAIDLAARKITNPFRRTIAIIAIVAALFLIWVELAVDAVSSAIKFLF